MMSTADMISSYDDYSNYTYPEIDESMAESFEKVRHYCEDILHPVIFTVGVTGNTGNIIIFTRQQMRQGRSAIERAAVMGLLMLSISDLCYCIFGLLTHFMRPFTEPGSSLALFSFAYGVYKPPILDTFQLISTLQTVAISVERYFAVSYPFATRRIANPRRTLLLAMAFYLAAILFNIPQFFENRIKRIPIENGTFVYMRLPGIITRSMGYTIAWAVFSILIPICVLTFCNIRFLMLIYQSQTRRYLNDMGRTSNSGGKLINNTGKDQVAELSMGTRRNILMTSTTATLMSIIFLFLLLVCPAMILKFFSLFVQDLSEKAFHNFKIALIVTNTLLTINFSVNFLLYCYALRDFRNTLTSLVKRHSPSSTMDNGHLNAIQFRGRCRPAWS